MYIYIYIYIHTQLRRPLPRGALRGPPPAAAAGAPNYSKQQDIRVKQ